MDADIKAKFDAYPGHIKPHMLALRSLIFELAAELNAGKVTEELKWMEPSYRVKNGSPVRMDWKAEHPDYLYLYFHCQTKLVETFRTLYSKELTFQGNRAIELPLMQPLPESIIAHCLTLALEYKQRRNLPLLGA
ncbi:DUF1801 domain-containing protein [Neptunicella marina]|uniref:DUF1801 domain-containing protein n=1 Tax=Neptunicella marina TaxID=2125989 RepID=A0A8J6IVE8_9ALTE|nr:DUF1801 domain-containing protein [Neptunicella marina]MBC3767416.1 DUF1801 domain-containing protein [Neptunicella marina]